MTAVVSVSCEQFRPDKTKSATGSSAPKPAFDMLEAHLKNTQQAKTIVNKVIRCAVCHAARKAREMVQRKTDERSAARKLADCAEKDLRCASLPGGG